MTVAMLPRQGVVDPRVIQKAWGIARPRSKSFLEAKRKSSLLHIFYLSFQHLRRYR